MDISTLAASLTTALVPLLPYLLKAGEKAAEETGKSVALQTMDWGKSLWAKLKPKVDEKPAALEAAEDVAKAPNDQDAQGALRNQLRKLLEADPSLAEEVNRMLEEGEAKGVVSVSGDRSVGIVGNVTGSTIVTGDRNKVKL